MVKDAYFDYSALGYNIFIERLWRTVKYENIYLNEYQTGLELVAGLANYLDFYNHERFHQSLGYRTPAQVYGKTNVLRFSILS